MAEELITRHDDMNWRTLESEYLIRRPWLTVRCDTVQFPNGTVHPEYYVLEYPTWVNVIAITKEGDFVMIRQYRHGIDETRYEIVAGVVDEGETPEQSARRELLEETGYAGGEWSEFAVLSANPTSQNNLTYTYLAVGVEKASSQHLENTEDIEVHLLSRDQVLQLLKSDEIKQALMAASLMKYFMADAKLL